MFIVTAKLRPKRLAAWCCAGAAVLCALLLGAGWFGMGPAAAVMAAAGAPDGSTNESRVAYLESLGWQVETEPARVEEIILPDTFDESWSEYLQLQEEQGFDLERCQGKRVKRYAYTITNYPTGETGIQAGLLVCDGRIVGGDVVNSALDGFLHGLTMPQS